MTDETKKGPWETSSVPSAEPGSPPPPAPGEVASASPEREAPPKAPPEAALPPEPPNLVNPKYHAPLPGDAPSPVGPDELPPKDERTRIAVRHCPSCGVEVRMLDAEGNVCPQCGYVMKADDGPRF